jgi:hypothetical protein
MKIILNRFIIALVFGIALMFCGPANAATRIIYPDGSGEWPYIQAAIDSSADGDTVLLADGTFSGSGNKDIRYYGKKIILSSQSGIREACIIDVQGEFNERAERGFIFDNNEDTLCILRNITVINGSADALCPQCEGGGIWIRNESSPKIVNVALRDNYALDGGGIMVEGDCNPIIRNCVFVNDSAVGGGGLMCLDNTSIIVSHCVFYQNSAGMRGGAVTLEGLCDVTLENCTITNNSSPDGSGIAAWDSRYTVINSIISFNDSGASVFANDDTSYTFEYSDIYGNEGGDWIPMISSQLGVDGNISGNPAYFDTANANYRIRSFSPCVDAGDPNSPYDPDGSRADMGALYYDHLGSIDDQAGVPSQFGLIQNYPNPFNAQTIIKFNLPEASDIIIDIYNIAGQKIEAITDDLQPAGYHQIIWDASSVASGVYFARLKAADYSATARMVLLK